MKILYIAPSFIPSRSANSVHVMKMCNALAEIGHNVYLITRGNKNIINDHYYYGVTSKFKIIKLRIKNTRFISSVIFSLFILIKIIRIKPKLIYSRHRFSLIVTTLFNLPVIFEDHSPPSGIYKSLIKNSINSNIHKIVLISNELKKLYKKVLPSIRNVKVIVAHDGSDPIYNQIDSTKILKLNKSNINCGYIGHLYKGRGIDIILKIAEDLPEISFHLIGGNENDLKYWRSKNMQNNVMIHGYVENRKIPAIINEFDILLAPYQKRVLLDNNTNTAQWMSPLKIFEYMAVGKPIVCSDLDVLKEVLENNFNSILVDPENLNEWVEAIKKLSTNISLREKIGKNAQNNFLKQYTWEKRVQKILNN